MVRIMMLIFHVVTVAALIAASVFNKPGTSVRMKKNDTATFRVMSYNIHHGNPPEKPGEIDLDAIVQVIKNANPDLVALQEVDSCTSRSSHINQAKYLAGRLNMDYCFGKSIDFDGGEYGLAILSRFPVEQEMVYQLPLDTKTNGEPRILLTSRIKLPDDSVIIFANTHLDHKKDPVNRKMQIEKIIHIVKQEKLPVIIGGDFNAEPGSEVIQKFDSHFIRTCKSCEATYKGNNNKAIDFIAYSDQDKFKVIHHEVIKENASDHYPVVAKFLYLN